MEKIHSEEEEFPSPNQEKEDQNEDKMNNTLNHPDNEEILKDDEDSKKNEPPPVPPPSDEEKKATKKTLYGELFSQPATYFAIFPAIFWGVGPILNYFFVGKVFNALSEYNMLKKAQVDIPSEIFDKYWNDCCTYSMWFAIVALLQGFGQGCQHAAWTYLGNKISANLKRKLFYNMMHSDVTFYDMNSIGTFITLLGEDAKLVQEGFGPSKGRFIANISQFLCGVIFTFVYQWRIGLIFIAAIPVITIVSTLIIGCVGKYGILQFMASSKATTILTETLSSIKTVRSFNREEYEVKRYKEAAQETNKYEAIVGYIFMAMMSCMNIMMWELYIGNLFYGVHLVRDSMRSGKNDFTMGDLISVYMFTFFSSFAVMMIQDVIGNEQRGVIAGARIIRFSNYQTTIPLEGGIKPEDFKGHIEFKNVTFKYPTREANVLKNVSFDVPPNKMVAFVGHSGSGKSTALHLIERYYDIQEGEILIDGKNIKEYDQRYLHQKIGLVNQEPVLFAGTIKENIEYGVDNATNEQIQEAAEISNARSFIEKLEMKYDTQVTEQGNNFSGGQKQRIAIARAVIKNPVILLCDEATSALDSKAEKKVQNALDKIMINRTSIIVAHRLSTVKNASTIYVFDSGEIVESGTHEGLLEKKGAYYNLVYEQLNEPSKNKNR